jgi:hypothetical protein
MVRRTHRLLIVILALAAGIILVLVLIWLGSKSRGPLSNMLDRAGSMVTNVENKIIIEKLSDSRKKKLSWLEPFLMQPDMFNKPKPLLLGVYDNLSAVCLILRNR